MECNQCGVRAAALLFLLAPALWPQFRSTVPLIVAPTKVTDAKGRFVDGLTEQDLILYDNNVPQPIQMDYEPYPISLVVGLQTAANAEAVVNKVDRIGILLTQLLAAQAGETALVTFDSRVTVRQDFTEDPDAITGALRKLKSGEGGASTLDAIMQSLRMLGARKPERRRIILIIAEKRDRTSKTPLNEVIAEVQRQNAAVYWLNFSPTLTTFSNRKYRAHGTDKDAPAEPPPDQGFDIIGGLVELAHMSAPNISELLPKATGGRVFNFLTRGALESAIQAIGEEVHSQYILTFQPKAGEAGQFHTIRVQVKDRPELIATTRAGYWSIQ